MLNNIYYRGTLYRGYKDICKKNGCSDVARFEQMYEAGYPVAVCLGKEEWDASQPAPKSRQKQADSMFSATGDARWYSTAIG